MWIHFPAWIPRCFAFQGLHLSMQYLQAKFENSNELRPAYFHDTFIRPWYLSEKAGEKCITAYKKWHEMTSLYSAALQWVKACSGFCFLRELHCGRLHGVTLQWHSTSAPGRNTRPRYDPRRAQRRHTHTHTLESFLIRGQQMEAWLGDSLWVITPAGDTWGFAPIYWWLPGATGQWTDAATSKNSQVPSWVLSRNYTLTHLIQEPGNNDSRLWMFSLSLRWFRAEAGSGGLETSYAHVCALQQYISFTGAPCSCLKRGRWLFWKKWTHRYLVGVLLSDQSHIFYSLFCKGGKQKLELTEMFRTGRALMETLENVTAAEGVFWGDTSFNYNILSVRFWQSDIKVS